MKNTAPTEKTSNDSEYIKRRLVNEQGNLTVWGLSLVHAYESVARYGFLPRISVNRKSKWIIMGSRIFNILDDNLRKQSHLVMSARDLLRCKSIPRSFTYDLKIYKTLHYLISKNNNKSSLVCEESVAKVLKETQAEFLVSNSTLDPINRIWIKVAKNLGIRTVCVQHGVYSNQIPDYVPEEDIVDYYVALDTSQIPIVNNYISSEKIRVLGNRDEFIWKPKSKYLKICLVGEDWERYGKNGIELKKDIIDFYIKLIEHLKKIGYDNFCYKPHPSENNLFGIEERVELIKNKDLDTCDLFIGFSSTLLKEMSSKGRLAIQIKDHRTHAHDFEEMGYCLSVERKSELECFSEINNIMKREIKVPRINATKLSRILQELSGTGNTKEYFEYLKGRTMLGVLYKKMFLYPQFARRLFGNILDVGCGIGDALLHFKNIIGVDLNPHAIDFCIKRGANAKLIDGNFLPFADDSFDSVLIDNVLEHIEDPVSLISEIKRVLNVNGLIVVGVPGLKGWNSDPDHKIFYDEESLIARFSYGGFAHIETFYTPFKKSIFLSKKLSQYCIYSTFRKVN